MPGFEIAYMSEGGKKFVFIKIPKIYNNRVDDVISAINAQTQNTLSKKTDVVHGADGSSVIQCGSKYAYGAYEGIITSVFEKEEFLLRFVNMGESVTKKTPRLRRYQI
jgi:hypothetical protein